MDELKRQIEQLKRENRELRNKVENLERTTKQFEESPVTLKTAKNIYANKIYRKNGSTWTEVT